MASLRTAFRAQRSSAKNRGIAWELSFDQWLAIWNASGHLQERGCKHGQYVMARFGDVGPYSESNVYICLHSQNVSDGYDNKPTRARRLGAGRGWTITKSRVNPYQVMCAGKRVGNYSTQEEAETAYAVAVASRGAAHVAIFFHTIDKRG